MVGMCSDLTNVFSEFDCMSQVADAQAGFTSHWDTWITQADFTTMVSYGLKCASPTQSAALVMLTLSHHHSQHGSDTTRYS